jgi:SAM-dependent methyltransferase
MSQTDCRTKALGDSYTSGLYLQRNPDWHATDSPWKAHKIAAMIGRNRLTPGTVCEVGCGAGEILVQLQRLLPATTDFYGYEISPQAHALCLPRANAHVRFRLGNITNDHAEKFDLLLVIDVFEHVSDYLGFLRELKRSAGKFIFHIPLDLSISAVLRAGSFLKVRRDVGHLHYFNRETAIATLEDCGYRLLDAQLTAGALEVSGRYGGVRTRLANLPRWVVGSISPSWAARLFGGWSLLVLAE